MRTDMMAPPHAREQIVLADWTQGMERSVLRQMIAVVSQPGVLSFAGGLPAPELFPTEQYAAALNHVLAKDRRALQYAPPFPPLVEHIVELMALRGVECAPDQVFITTGAQQALSVLSRLLLNPGGDLILEELVYTGIQQAVAPMQPNLFSVATHLETGIDVDAAAAAVRAGIRPAFLYVIPEAHNPLGVSIGAEKRQKLITLARQYGVPLVEDDPYGFLTYDGPAQPPLRALDDKWVFYVGSFSKILAPALRLGWIIAPADLVPQLTVVKEAGDLESSALTQRAVAAFLDAGHLPAHLDRLRSAYRARRDAMLATLSRSFPAEASWTSPVGGMFIWIELPTTVDTVTLLRDAMAEEQVAFIPGHAFALEPGRGCNCLRLNFSNASVEDIEDGVTRLARVVKRHL